MTLGKNFRLPSDIRPKSYDADLRIDMAEGRFEGLLTITLGLSAARREIVLHAVDLEVTSAAIASAEPRAASAAAAAGPSGVWPSACPLATVAFITVILAHVARGRREACWPVLR